MMNLSTKSDRPRTLIIEQWWVGFGCMLFWAVVLMVFCKSCAHAGEVKLSWNANPETEKVLAYRIYRGIDLVGTTAQTSLTLTLPDEPVSLTITAQNAAGESDHSAPLYLYPITLQVTEDLVNWSNIRVIHRSRKPKEFLRLKIQP